MLQRQISLIINGVEKLGMIYSIGPKLFRRNIPSSFCHCEEFRSVSTWIEKTILD